jgi:hypothetical protein
MRSSRLWLCLPVVGMCGFDGCLTLLGQPADYWSRSYTVIREGNPVAAWFLTLHPAAFALSAVPYFLVIAGVVNLLPRLWAVAFAFTVATGHAFAAAVWLWHLCEEPLLPITGLGAVWIVLTVVAYRKGCKPVTPSV